MAHSSMHKGYWQHVTRKAAHQCHMQCMNSARLCAVRTCKMPLILHSTPSPTLMAEAPPAMIAKARLSLRCHSRILQASETATAH